MKLCAEKFEEGAALACLVRYQISDLHDLIATDFFVSMRLNYFFDRSIKVVFKKQPPCGGSSNSSSRHNAAGIISAKANFRIMIADCRPIDAAVNTFN